MKRKGFTGIIHLLIGIVVLMIIIILLNIIEFNNFNRFEIKLDLIILCIIVGGGATLFPDLDCERSTAIHRLGNTGKLINLFMRSTGAIIWKLYHFKDFTPRYKHRIFYHTSLFCFILILGSVTINIELGFMTSFLNLKIKDLPYFIMNNIILIFYIFLTFLYVRLFISTIMYKFLNNVLKRKYLNDTICFLISLFILIYIINMKNDDIKTIINFGSLGYAIHIITDLFSIGSAPIFYPFPINNQAYYRPNFPFQIKTDGIEARILGKICKILIPILFIFILIIITFRV